MATATVKGASVVRGSVHLPRVGVWHADLELDAEDAAPFAGATSLELGEGALSLSCTITRAGLSRGTVFVRLVGGAAGLSRELEPKSYRDVPARLVLSELLQGAGETLSASADAGALGTQLAKWERLQQPAAYALASLLARLPVGTSWRVVPDGSVWAGPETWPAVDLEHELVLEQPHLAREVLALETPTLLPGTTFRGARVEYVSHHISPEAVRSTVWRAS